MHTFRKYLLSTLPIVLLLILTSCGKHTNKSRRVDNEGVNVTSHQPIWKVQLHKMMTIGNERMEVTKLQMVGYKLKGRIKSDKQVKHLIKKLTAGDQYMPSYNPEKFKETFKLVKIRDIKSGHIKGSMVNYNFQRGKKYLASALHKGQKIINIHWTYEGKPITTIAIVSDSLGIVYGNIITNSIRVEVQHTSGQEIVRIDTVKVSVADTTIKDVTK